MPVGIAVQGAWTLPLMEAECRGGQTENDNTYQCRKR